MHSKIIAMAMAILSTSLSSAAPISDGKTITTNRNTTLIGTDDRFKPSCICKDPSKWDADYNCQIGVDWANGNGCESIRANLRNVLATNDNDFDDPYWRCYAGDQNVGGNFQNTMIRFATGQGYSSTINPILAAFWPMVNEFNCPDY
ncbi:hypothetical protein LTR86_003710 [Recurvomyces mirabilis]|nr:hypothetical protein LTR86_003710 [Recurvomyces mirabilis]